MYAPFTIFLYNRILSNPWFESKLYFYPRPTWPGKCFLILKDDI